MNFYDVIIIGGGASGLFSSIFLPKEMSKLILEKSEKCGTKVLLSGGERCNVTNMDINIETDYFGQNKKALPSIFHKFSNQDMINFLNKNGIETKVEENGRVLLKCGNSKQLLELLMKLAGENNVDIKTGVEIKSVDAVINPPSGPVITGPPSSFLKEVHFKIETNQGTFFCKNLIIATGGKSYPQAGATNFTYEIAKQFGIECMSPYRALCGIETVQDMSGITGNSMNLQMQVMSGKKVIYDEIGDLLFTHWGISGPVVFNSTLVIGNSKDCKIKLIFDLEKVNKKIINYLKLDVKKNFVELDIKDMRPWEEAKVSGGGVLMSELKPNLETKKVPGLYFIGEAVDITGKTGGYNLQWARSSGYNCAKSFK